MKNRVLPSLMLVAVAASPSTVLARSFMPRIDQLRNKIETIAQNTPQTNIKELLEQARIERDANGTVHKIISFGQPQADISSLEKEVKDLYWSNRTSLVEQIQAKKAAPKTEHHDLLVRELSQRYPNNNRAVFTLASDLSNEETKLTDLTTRTIKSIGEEKKSPATNNLNGLLATIAKLKQNLKTITNFVNETLMS